MDENDGGLPGEALKPAAIDDCAGPEADVGDGSCIWAICLRRLCLDLPISTWWRSCRMALSSDKLMLFTDSYFCSATCYATQQNRID